MEYAIASVFVAGGAMTLGLYAVIVWCAPSSAMSVDTTWGYLGRYGSTVKVMWALGTLVTATSVLNVFWWLVFSLPDAGGTALAGASIFMSGAIGWPVGVLSNSMRLSQLGVALAAAGSVVLLTYLILNSAPGLILAAGSIMTFHHVIIDGLWAVLTPPGAARLMETIL